MGIPLFFPDINLDWFPKKKYDFVSDKMNHQFVARVLFACSIFYGGYIFASSPLTCAVPAGSRVEYAENFCMARSTIYTINRQNASMNKLYDKDKSSYYKSIWLLMLLASFMNYIPQFLWSLIVSQKYTQLPRLLKSIIANQDEIGKCEKTNETYGSLFAGMIRRRNKNSLSLSYLAIKILYLAISIFQVYFITSLVKCEVFEGLKVAIIGEEAKLEYIFPMTVTCHFWEPSTVYVVKRTAHCSMNGNFIALCLYRLLCVLFVLQILWNILALLARIVQLCSKRSNVDIDDWLEKLKDDGPMFQEHKLDFNDHLGRDGILFLEMINDNISPNVAETICCETFIHLLSVEAVQQDDLVVL